MAHSLSSLGFVLLYSEKESNLSTFTTLTIAEILCVKNARAIVVCGFLCNEIILKIYAESLKKIMGAIWELPAK